MVIKRHCLLCVLCLQLSHGKLDELEEFYQEQFLGGTGVRPCRVSRLACSLAFLCGVLHAVPLRLANEAGCHCSS